MDWNRDGKVDAHDAALYHTVINSDNKSESSSGTNSGSRRSYSNSNKLRPNQTPAANTYSSGAGWVIAIIVIAILYFFFS